MIEQCQIYILGDNRLKKKKRFNAPTLYSAEKNYQKSPSQWQGSK